MCPIILQEIRGRYNRDALCFCAYIPESNRFANVFGYITTALAENEKGFFAFRSLVVIRTRVLFMLSACFAPLNEGVTKRHRVKKQTVAFLQADRRAPHAKVLHDTLDIGAGGVQ